MQRTAKVRIEWNDQLFDEGVLGTFREAAMRIAAEILTEAIFNIRDNEQIDTGAMWNSGYLKYVDPEGLNEIVSTYDQAKSLAAGLRGDALFFPEPDLDLDDGVLALVGFSVEYAVYQEAIQPFFAPAAEAVADRKGAQLIREAAEGRIPK